jgi:hypothetical protein
VKHYFLYCPAFAAQRQQMLDDMVRDIPEKIQPYLTYHVDKTVSTVQFTNVLLNGTGDEKTDKILFQSVQRFIANTKRFQ